MSTYLVAMLVGDFACRSGAADGVSIRVWQPEGRASIIPQQVVYQPEPDIDIARDPVIMEVALDTNPAFGNPGFVIEH